jgi:ABC-type multidrug transport system fused ATPase/permease subunit
LSYWLSTGANIVDTLQLSRGVAIGAVARVASASTAAEAEAARVAPAGAPVVRVRDLWFHYRPTRYSFSAPAVLRGVSFDIYPRELLSIVGHVGCGKSTLALLLAGLLRPTGGDISVAVSADGPDDRWSRVRLVDGQDWFFTGTISQNIRVVNPDLPLTEMVRICDAIGLHDFIRRFPQGYETVVGERGARLSSGQRQLLAIARAIAARPSAVILDEATTCLDAEAERHAIDGLRTLVPGPVILIAHRLASVRRSDRVVVIDDGQIVSAGSHDELIDSSDAYTKLHKLQIL